MEDLSQAPFSNQELTTNNLPSIKALNKTPIASRYAKSNRFINAIVLLLLILTTLVFNLQNLFTISHHSLTVINYCLLGACILQTLSSIYQSFSDLRKFYTLREQDISYSSGLLFKSTVSQPILRIQHVEL